MLFILYKAYQLALPLRLGDSVVIFSACCTFATSVLGVSKTGLGLGFSKSSLGLLSVLISCFGLTSCFGLEGEGSKSNLGFLEAATGLSLMLDTFLFAIKLLESHLNKNDYILK